ncbi:uncharacterized protein LOC124161059 isoform X2 [Ischnura elegans]|uniref:uncharacterized protein LOC124161059 isoform X2 n=1 Tax=Ischnura elegans TaxID=197161 RepID=UPI001ED8AEF4|nr:uncharacterized protein LOC124161059 isoform X2 [Ischnura elegans]
MSEESTFLDELLADIDAETNAKKFPCYQYEVPLETANKPAVRTPLEEKLRRQNAKLRNVNSHYRKTLGEREARLMELLKEKLAMKEEEEKIQEYRKKLEEANLFIQASEQLNKQFHELAKASENDKKVAFEKVDKLQRKVRKLKKEVDRVTQQKFQERKRRLKLLKIIIELSEILISTGLLPKKYKEPFESWQYEFQLSGHELKEEDDLDEEDRRETNDPKKSSSKLVAQVQLPKSKDHCDGVVSKSQKETSIAMIPDVKSLRNEAENTSWLPAGGEPDGAPVNSSTKGANNILTSPPDEMVRDGSNFGSTVSSPSISVSCGEQCSSGSSVGSEVLSGSQVFSSLSSIGSKSSSSYLGSVEISADISSEEDWCLDGSPQGSPFADVLENPKRIQSVTVFKGSGNSLSVDAILKEMCVELPSLLQPLELGDVAPPSSQNAISRERLCENLSEKIADVPAVCESISGTKDQRMTAISTTSPVSTNFPVNATSRLSTSSLSHENGVTTISDSTAGNEVCGNVTSVPSENSSSVYNKDLSAMEIENCGISFEASNMNASNCNESSDEIQHSPKNEVNILNEVSCDVSSAVLKDEEPVGGQIENNVGKRGSRSKKGRGKRNEAKKVNQDDVNRPREMNHPEKSVEENTSVQNIPDSIKEAPVKVDCQRRFSARLRSNSKVTDPNAVNDSSEVRKGKEKHSSLGSNLDESGKLNEREEESVENVGVFSLVDYSDSSDTCDSVLPVLQELDENVFKESLDNTVDAMKEQAVEVIGSLNLKQVQVQIESVPCHQRDVISVPVASDSHQLSGISLPKESRTTENQEIKVVNSLENGLSDPQSVLEDPLCDEHSLDISTVEPAVASKAAEKSNTSSEKVVESTGAQKPAIKLIADSFNEEVVSGDSEEVEKSLGKSTAGNLSYSILSPLYNSDLVREKDQGKNDEENGEKMLSTHNLVKDNFKESLVINDKSICSSTEDTASVREKPRGSCKQDRRLNKLDRKNAVKVEISQSSVVNTPKTANNEVNALKEVLTGDKGEAKKSLSPCKEHVERHSKSRISSSDSPTSSLEKGKNLLSSGPLGKIMSFFGGMAVNRLKVPFFFGSHTLLQFPGVKFRLCGKLAPELYPDPYSFPKRPLSNFGGSDFKEFYEMLRTIVDESKSEREQRPDIKFHKLGSLAPPDYTNLYLCPRRLNINFDHRRRKKFNHCSEEVEATSKKVEINSLVNEDCLPCPCLPSMDEEVSSDGSSTLCNGSENSLFSSSETSVDSDVLLDSSDMDDNGKELDNVAPVDQLESVDVFNRSTQVLQGETLNDKGTSLSDLHVDHLGVRASSSLSETSLCQSLAVDSQVFIQETQCVGPPQNLMESTCHGVNISGSITEVKSDKNGKICDVNTTIVNKQETENAGFTKVTAPSLGCSEDSLFSSTHSRDSFSSGGYSSDKESSPNGSVFDAAFGKNTSDHVEGKPLVELSIGDIKAESLIRAGQSGSSDSPNFTKVDLPRNTDSESLRLVACKENGIAVEYNNHSEVDVKKAFSSSKGNCSSGFENIPRQSSHQQESICHLPSIQPEKDFCTSEATDNFICDIMNELENSTSVCVKKDEGEKSEEGIRLEKVNGNGLVNDSGIANLFTTKGPGDDIHKVPKGNMSDDGGMFVESKGHLLDAGIPLGSFPFSDEAEAVLESIINCHTDINENKTMEICKQRMKQEAELQVLDRVSIHSFSDESAYSSLSRSVVSGPGSVDSGQVVASSQEPDLDMKEKMVDSIHIDNCLMAETLDDLIEMAIGLPPFDDACLSSVATKLSETSAEDNLLTEAPSSLSPLCESKENAQLEGKVSIQKFKGKSLPRNFSEKDLFGTDFSDSLSDNEPLANLLRKNHGKRRLRVGQMSGQGKRMKVSSKIQSSRGRGLRTRGGRKSFMSKAIVTSSSDSEESQGENDESTSKPPAKFMQLRPSGNRKEADEFCLKLPETNDAPQELKNITKDGDAIEDMMPLLANSVDGMESDDNNQIISSSDSLPKSHLSMQSAPSGPGILQKGTVETCRAYPSRKGNNLPQEPPALDKLPIADDKDISLPENATNPKLVQMNDVLDDLPLSSSEVDEVLPITPTPRAPGRRKQSLVNTLECDDVVIIEEVPQEAKKKKTQKPSKKCNRKGKRKSEPSLESNEKDVGKNGSNKNKEEDGDICTETITSCKDNNTSDLRDSKEALNVSTASPKLRKNNRKSNKMLSGDDPGRCDGMNENGNLKSSLREVVAINPIESPFAAGGEKSTKTSACSKSPRAKNKRSECDDSFNGELGDHCLNKESGVDAVDSVKICKRNKKRTAKSKKMAEIESNEECELKDTSIIEERDHHWPSEMLISSNSTKTSFASGCESISVTKSPLRSLSNKEVDNVTSGAEQGVYPPAKGDSESSEVKGKEIIAVNCSPLVEKETADEVDCLDESGSYMTEDTVAHVPKALGSVVAMLASRTFRRSASIRSVDKNNVGIVKDSDLPSEKEKHLSEVTFPVGKLRKDQENGCILKSPIKGEEKGEVSELKEHLSGLPLKKRISNMHHDSFCSRKLGMSSDFDEKNSGEICVDGRTELDERTRIANKQIALSPKVTSSGKTLNPLSPVVESLLDVSMNCNKEKSLDCQQQGLTPQSKNCIVLVHKWSPSMSSNSSHKDCSNPNEPYHTPSVNKRVARSPRICSKTSKNGSLLDSSMSEKESLCDETDNLSCLKEVSVSSETRKKSDRLAKKRIANSAEPIAQLEYLEPPQEENESASDDSMKNMEKESHDIQEQEFTSTKKCSSDVPQATSSNKCKSSPTHSESSNLNGEERSIDGDSLVLSESSYNPPVKKRIAHSPKTRSRTSSANHLDSSMSEKESLCDEMGDLSYVKEVSVPNVTRKKSDRLAKKHIANSAKLTEQFEYLEPPRVEEEPLSDVSMKNMEKESHDIQEQEFTPTKKCSSNVPQTTSSIKYKSSPTLTESSTLNGKERSIDGDSLYLSEPLYNPPVKKRIAHSPKTRSKSSNADQLSYKMSENESQSDETGSPSSTNENSLLNTKRMKNNRPAKKSTVNAPKGITPLEHLEPPQLELMDDSMESIKKKSHDSQEREFTPAKKGIARIPKTIAHSPNVRSKTANADHLGYSTSENESLLDGTGSPSCESENSLLNTKRKKNNRSAKKPTVNAPKGITPLEHLEPPQLELMDDSVESIKKKSHDSQEREFTPAKKCIAGIPKASVTLTKSLSSSVNSVDSINGDSLYLSEPLHNLPVKKGITLSAKAESKTSNADGIDFSLTENEPSPDKNKSAHCSSTRKVKNSERDKPRLKDKDMADIPETSVALTKSESSTMTSGEGSIEKDSPVSSELCYNPPVKKRIAHSPKARSKTSIADDIDFSLTENEQSPDKTKNAHCSSTRKVKNSESDKPRLIDKDMADIPETSVALTKSESSTMTSGEGSIEKDSPVSSELCYNPPVKKRIAHSPKARSKTSIADDIDFSLTENEPSPDKTKNAHCSSTRKVKNSDRDKPRLKGKVSKISKLRNIVSIMKGYRPASVNPDPKAQRNIANCASDGYSRKDLPNCADGSDLKVSCERAEGPTTHRPPKRKLEVCEVSTKMRRMDSESVKELPKLDEVDKLPKDSQLPPVNTERLPPALDNGETASKHHQVKAEIDVKPILAKSLWEAPLLISPLKASPVPKKKDLSSISAVEEKMLEEMEVPPLSPLSDDVVVDALIDFPDSSDGEINETPDYHSTPKSNPARDVKFTVVMQALRMQQN